MYSFRSQELKAFLYFFLPLFPIEQKKCSKCLIHGKLSIFGRKKRKKKQKLKFRCDIPNWLDCKPNKLHLFFFTFCLIFHPDVNLFSGFFFSVFKIDCFQFCSIEFLCGIQVLLESTNNRILSQQADFYKLNNFMVSR